MACVQSASPTCEDGGEGERHSLGLVGVDADGFCCQLVFTDGSQVAAVLGVDEAPCDVESQNHADQAEGHVGEVGNTDITCGTAGEVLGVVEENADALTEAKAGDQEVVALQTQRRHAHDEGEERRHQAAVERIEQRAAGDRSPGGAEVEVMRKALKLDDHDDENAAADEK